MKKIVALVALALAGTAQAAMIDDFNNGLQSTTAPAANVAFGNATSGPARTATASSTGTPLNVSIDTGTNPGLYAHGQDPGVTGSSYIEYAMGGADMNGALNDLNAFRVKLNTVDLNGTLYIYANDGTNNATVNITTNAILLASGLSTPAYADFLFSNFVGVDFNNISVLRLGVNGNAQDALDITIDNFQTVCSNLGTSGGSGTNPGNGNCNPPTTVPEPATLGLLGLGLLGLGALRRRKA